MTAPTSSSRVPRSEIATALAESGYAVTSGPTVESLLRQEIESIARLLGARVSTVVLDREKDPLALEVHSEGIYQGRLTPHFILGCVSAGIGGVTSIYDARLAAKIVMSEHPELAGTVIQYGSAAHGSASEHRLVFPGELATGGLVLIFRQRCATNRITAIPNNWGEEMFYIYMESVLVRALVYSHSWRAGDILVVDNRVTLHGRTPFTGHRRMIRTRIDEISAGS